LQAFVIVSLIYVLINFGLTRLATWLEQRLRQRPGSRPVKAVGPGASAPEPEVADAVQHELPTAVAPR
jgi:hypothetical protein